MDRDRDTKVDADWKLLIGENQLWRMNRFLAGIISEKFKGENVVVAAIVKGAIYFCVDLTREMTLRHSIYLIEASSYKDEETQEEQVEILSIINPKKFEGKKVILIDELFDNGRTLQTVKDKILKEVPSLTPDRIFTCTMFRKSKEISYPKPDLVGFKIPNVWVVGYGLDDKQEMRQLQQLWAKPKSGSAITEDDELFTNQTKYWAILDDIHQQTKK
jgi:hypoxanthine phosphoribosyltransferase